MTESGEHSTRRSSSPQTIYTLAPARTTLLDYLPFSEAMILFDDRDGRFWIALGGRNSDDHHLQR